MGYWTLDRGICVQALAVLCSWALLPQCLSLARCINGYWGGEEILLVTSRYEHGIDKQRPDGPMVSNADIFSAEKKFYFHLTLFYLPSSDVLRQR